MTKWYALALVMACATPLDSPPFRAVAVQEARANAGRPDVSLRCAATTRDLAEASLLTPIEGARLSLVYDVAHEQLTRVGDRCSLTATVQDAKGAWHGCYAAERVGVAEQTTLGELVPCDQPEATFRISYPFRGRYEAVFSPWDRSLSVALAVLPRTVQAVIGTPVGFRVLLVASPSATYQWQTKLEHEPESAWHDVASGTASEVQVVAESAYQFCQTFRVQVRDGDVKTTSATAVLVNQLPPPVFTTDLPEQLTVTEGARATLRIATDNASYVRWMRDGDEALGGEAHGDTYTTAALTRADDGARFQVEAVHYAGNHQCTQAGTAVSRTLTVHVSQR